MKSTVRLNVTAIACLLAVAAVPALAQQIYRSVGPNGKVTYSDQPPVVDAQPSSVAGSIVPNTQVQLPFELRQSMSRFPVTLYSGNACAPCLSGRNLLAARGIPFSEKIVSTQDDIDAMQKIAGDNGLPVLTVGNQVLKGFAADEWTQYLNAAGYPKTSQLPANYRNPPPAPVVVKAEAPTPPVAQHPVVPTPPPSGPTPSNPAGIRF